MSGKKKWKARYNDIFECCLRAEHDLRDEQQKFYEAQHAGAVAQARVLELGAELVEQNHLLTIAEDAHGRAMEQVSKMHAEIAKLGEEIGQLDGLLSLAERERDRRPSLASHQSLLDELVAARTQDTEFKQAHSQKIAGYERSLREANEEITRLNNEQEAAWERGFHEGHRAALYQEAQGLTNPQDAHSQGDTETIPTVDVAEFHEPQAKSAIELVKPETDEGEGMLIAYVPATSLKAGDRVRFEGTGGRFVTVLASEFQIGTGTVEVDIRISNKYDSTPFGTFAYTMEANAVVERNESP